MNWLPPAAKIGRSETCPATAADDLRLRGGGVRRASSFRHGLVRAAFFALSTPLLTTAVVAAQGLDSASILKPLGDSWPTYSGDYSGKRYSSLTQINQSNVKNLTLAWVSRVTAGAGGGRGGGADHRRRRGRGRSGGRRRHQYQARRSSRSTAFCMSRRPIMPGRWMRATATSCGITSGAPRAARTSAIAGWGCGETGCTWRRPTIIWSPSTPRPARSAGTKSSPISSSNISRPWRPSWSATISWWAPATIWMSRACCKSFDPETGAVQWKYYSVPMKKGDPGSTPGTTWMRRSTAAARSGSPAPTIRRRISISSAPAIRRPPTRRRAAAKATIFTPAPSSPSTSIPARWPGIIRPRRTTRTIGIRAQTPVLVDGEFNGKPRKMVLTASRNGYYFTLDRVTGEHLVTSKYSDIGELGQGSRPDGRAGARSREGLRYRRRAGVAGQRRHHQLASARVQSRHRLVLRSAKRQLRDVLSDRDRSARRDGAGRQGRESVGSTGGYLTAIDYKTGKIAWRHHYPGTGGGGSQRIADHRGQAAVRRRSGRQHRGLRSGRRQDPVALAYRAGVQRAGDVYARRTPISAGGRGRHAFRVHAVLRVWRRRYEDEGRDASDGCCARGRRCRRRSLGRISERNRCP